MADVHKRIEKAEKYLQKGKQEDALEEYLGILEDDPSNDNVRQTAADLSLALGRNSEAISLLGTVFDKQASIGDQAKAVANYRKLAKLATPSVDQTFKFSQFVEKADKKLALEGYELAVKSYLAADRRAEALTGLKRILALDASIPNHKRVADLAAAMGDSKAAGASLLKLAAAEPDNAAAYLEKGYSLDPTNTELGLQFGKALTKKGDLDKAISVLGPLATPESPQEMREAYAHALLAAKRAAEAEPIVWQLFEANPAQSDEVASLIGTLIEVENHSKALSLTRKLDELMAKKGQRREFVSLVKEITTKHPPGIEYLEYLVDVYNQHNREQDYCETLTGLFQLYYAAGNFIKAGDALDRSAEVDPYQSGHQKRLELLRGKIDANRFSSIANRLQSVGVTAPEAEPDQAAGFENEPTVLEDFMLQAEIFLQYSMRSKAVERLERIHKLFPREEDKNEKLRNLYMNAGFVPKYDGPPPIPPHLQTQQMMAAGGGTPLSPFGQAPSYGGGGNGAQQGGQMPQLSHDENAVDNFTRVTEITRNIYRQATVKGVLFAAVNDVGRHYNASRCVAGLITPGKPPSAALEYCSPGIQQSDVQHIVKLLGAVQHLSVEVGMVAIDNVLASSELESIKPSLEALGIKSLLAAPLMDAATDEPTGILLLEQCDQSRQWRPTDSVVLKTIADQMVLAVNNAKLRSLMKNLAVTDEKSGLLKRSSYLDVLLSETRRALAQNSTAALLLLHFGKASSLAKELGEAGVENMMQQVAQNISSQIRQNDVAVRYELTTIALILPDTTDKNAFFVVEKMRKVMNGYKIPSTDRQVNITVGIAEAVMLQQYDPIDIVTEVINRAEAALDAAKAEGENSAKSLAPQLHPAAVA